MISFLKPAQPLSCTHFLHYLHNQTFLSLMCHSHSLPSIPTSLQPSSIYLSTSLFLHEPLCPVNVTYVALHCAALSRYDYSPPRRCDDAGHPRNPSNANNDSLHYRKISNRNHFSSLVKSPSNHEIFLSHSYFIRICIIGTSRYQF